MQMRKIIQRVSAGVVLGLEALAAVALHETHSIALVAPIMVLLAILTIWALESGIDWCVKNMTWAANLFGMKPASKVKIHGYWYSSVRGGSGRLLGGSVFRVKAGLDDVEFEGVAVDFTVAPVEWNCWSGSGVRHGSDGILYAYTGEEGKKRDEGFGMYSFPAGQAGVVHGSFYGKNLPKRERYRTTRGKRVPKTELTRSFRRKVAWAQEQALAAYLETQPAQVPPEEA